MSEEDGQKVLAPLQARLDKLSCDYARLRADRLRLMEEIAAGLERCQNEQGQQGERDMATR
jgi:hypothetical protein